MIKVIMKIIFEGIMMNFSGINVLITGASKGIGAEIAKTLAG